VLFSPAELADVERSVKRLVLAAQDMVECRAAVDFLGEGTDIPCELRRALETAAPVAYARPWGNSNALGALGTHWRPNRWDQLVLHEELIKLRNSVSAHTHEEIGAQWMSDISTMLETSMQSFLRPWRPLNHDLFPQIAELAASQKVRFVEGVRELVQLQSP
jgi:hypothetical protein